MSAENAWKVAAAYCREAVIKEMMENIQDFSPAHVSERLNSLPMPPAFRAEVEAEARAFAQREHPYADLHVEALAEIKATIDGNSDQPVAAIIEGLLQEIKARSDRLSRLEAKGESYE